MNVWATFPHFARFLVLGSMIWGIFLLARYWVSRRNKHEQILGHSHPTWEELTEAVRAYGRNSASVVHLYGGMRHFKSWFHLRTSPDEPSPIVGYVALDHQNVVLTDPLCRDFQIKAILNEFARHTQMEGKDSVLFAIDQKTADRAAELGFGILKIGQEAHFDLPNYDASQLNPKILSAVRQAAKKGVSVREVPWSEIEDNYKLRQELDQVLEEWLQSRRGERLQLLSEVSPFKQGSAKRYFLAEQEGRVTSYLACSPIFVDHGFYLHDTIRRPTTINGTTEMLYIQALQMLKASGVKFASLGVAPMAGLGEPGINADYPWVNRVMNWVFENHDTLYRFKTLHRFKAKFNPTYEAPSYIAFYPPKFKIAYALTVATLFNPRGFLGDLTHKWRRWQEGDQLPRPLVSLLEPSILTLSRPVPFTFREILSRCKFTFLMLFLNVYTYENTTNLAGDLHPYYLSGYGFNFEQFMQHKWEVLVTSNFLHFNFMHLFSNMVMLVLFSGTLELVGGTYLASLVYLIGLNANVPYGMMALPLLHVLSPTLFAANMHFFDVGASLGIMASLGALLQFMRYKRRILVAIMVVTMVATVIESAYIGADHCVALVIGYAMAHWYLHRGAKMTLYRHSVSPSSTAKAA